jgi:hypothetical protein
MQLIKKTNAAILAAFVFLISFELLHHPLHVIPFAQHVHHLAHLVKLLDKSIHFMQVAATAFGDARLARHCQALWISTLLRCHRLNDRFDF